MRSDSEVAAERLHTASIRLLRGLRVVDERSGLSGPRLSALSVVVFRGPITIGGLATAEQVRPATISRMVSELERAGLLRRRADPADRRVWILEATAKGRRILERGKQRRVDAIVAKLESLSAREQAAVGRAAAILSRLFP